MRLTRDRSDDVTVMPLGENAASIEAAHRAGVIPDESYAYYLAEAQAGRDVYCYESAAGWNLWLGYAVDSTTGYRGVRIPLSGQEGGAR